MAGFSARNFVPDFETAEDLEKALANPLRHDEELENFLGQVDQVADIIKGLASNDTVEQQKALMRADVLIREEGDGPDIDPDTVKCEVTQSRTVINKGGDKGDAGQGDDMSKEAFMRSVEEDAKQRSEMRKIRKEQSDVFRKKGNLLFREKDYAGALFNFNEAIKLIKDSPCLYNNRALTYIRIKIYSAALEDCEHALNLEPHSIRARMLKAKALFSMGEAEKCRECLRDAQHSMPHHVKIIEACGLIGHGQLHPNPNCSHSLFSECSKNIFSMGEKDAKKEEFEFDLPNEKVWKEAELNKWH